MNSEIPTNMKEFVDDIAVVEEMKQNHIAMHICNTTDKCTYLVWQKTVNDGNND